MAPQRRRSNRVGFSRGIDVRMMSIDGTWACECTILDISQDGARLRICGSIAGLNLTEFFLLLCASGSAYRRCQMIRVDGDQIGVAFVKQSEAPNKDKQRVGLSNQAG